MGAGIAIAGIVISAAKLAIGGIKAVRAKRDARQVYHDELRESDTIEMMMDSYVHGVAPNNYYGVWCHMRWKHPRHAIWDYYRTVKQQFDRIDQLTVQLRREHPEIFVGIPSVYSDDKTQHTDKAEALLSTMQGVPSATNSKKFESEVQRNLMSGSESIKEAVGSGDSTGTIENYVSNMSVGGKTWIAIAAVFVMLTLSRLLKVNN